jgi:hypothetical protein
MICPHCKKAINTVNVYSQCQQKAYLKGNTIKFYYEGVEILDTLDIECSVCGHSIKRIVEEDC